MLVDQRQLNGQEDQGVDLLDRHLQLVGDELALVQRALAVRQTLAGVLLGQRVASVYTTDINLDFWPQGLRTGDCNNSSKLVLSDCLAFKANGFRFQYGITGAPSICESRSQFDGFPDIF